MKLGLALPALVLSFCLVIPLQAEEQPPAAPNAPAAAASTKPEPYTAAEFPQWALDLRRGEAVAFGALPFSLFFSQFAVDTYRCSQHGWDRNYAPWPLKTAGAVSMSESEYLTTFAAACVGAVVVAVVDFAIVAINRSKKQKSVEQRLKAEFTVERTPATPILVPGAAPPEPDAGER